MRKSEPTSINAPYLDPPERLLLKSKQAHEGGLAGPSADGRRRTDDGRHCGDGKHAPSGISQKSNFIAKAGGVMIKLYFNPGQEAVAIRTMKKAILSQRTALDKFVLRQTQRTTASSRHSYRQCWGRCLRVGCFRHGVKKLFGIICAIIRWLLRSCEAPRNKSICYTMRPRT
jgi:hypothetical protein